MWGGKERDFKMICVGVDRIEEKFKLNENIKLHFYPYKI